MFFKLIFALIGIFVLATTTIAQDGTALTLAQEPLAVHIFPSVTRDDDVAYLYDSGSSPLQIVFFTRDQPLSLKDSKFFLELPEGMSVRSVSVVEGWREVAKEYSLPNTPTERNGKAYRRWELPHPSRATAKLAANRVGDYAFSGFFSIPFLQVTGQPPKNFTAHWEVQGGPSQISGAFPIKLLPRPQGHANPKRFPIWISQKWTPYMDETEFDENVQLMRELGITHVNIWSTPRIPDANERWKKAGVGLYSTFHEPLFLYDKAPANKYADPRNYFVGLDGKRVQGTRNYRNTPYCPSAMARPDSDIFRELSDRIVDQAKAGIEYTYSDHEIDIYSLCFCEDCREAFAVFSGAPRDVVMQLAPVALIRKYPLEWYKFRSWQSAEMVRQLKAKVQPQYPNIKIGLNDGLNYWTQKIDGLGWGHSLFAEDVRLVDDAVDFHNIDALGGTVHDVTLLEAQQPKELKKPMIVRVMGSLWVGWEQPHISARWELSKKTGRKMGYNQRPAMQRLMMVNQAATGAHGEELFIGAHESDAAVANASDEALEIIARLEDVYLDGSRNESLVQLFDVTEGKSPYLQDDGLVSGDYWLKFYWRVYGGPVYRVHRYGNRTFISLFNWDPEQDKTWVLRLPQQHDGGYVKNFLQNDVMQSAAGDKWSKEALQNGIAVQVPKLDMVILEITPDAPATRSARTNWNAAFQQDATSRAQSMQPYDPWHYLEPNPKGLRTDLNWRIDTAIQQWPERFSPDSPPLLD